MNIRFAILQMLNAIDIVTDITLAALPTFMVWNMHLRRREKCVISILLGLGALYAPCCRIPYELLLTFSVAQQFPLSSVLHIFKGRWCMSTTILVSKHTHVMGD